MVQLVVIAKMLTLGSIPSTNSLAHILIILQMTQSPHRLVLGKQLHRHCMVDMHMHTTIAVKEPTSYILHEHATVCEYRDIYQCPALHMHGEYIQTSCVGTHTHTHAIITQYCYTGIFAYLTNSNQY